VETAQARAEAALRRDATLEAVAYAAQRFLEDGDWGRSVPAVLRRLGEATASSRVWLCETLASDEPAIALRAQWLAAGVEPLVEVGDMLDLRRLERWTSVLGRGDLLHGSRETLPEHERDALGGFIHGATLIAPVAVDGVWWGTIALDDRSDDRVWSQIEIDALRAAAGTLGAAIGRERSDRRLREAEARYRSIVERTPAVTYQELTDEDEDEYVADAAIVYMSPQIERLLGYPADRWASVPGFWTTVTHPDDLERVRLESDRSGRTGDPYSQEYRMIATDGRVVWVRDEAVLIRDDDGHPLIWQGVMVDITDRKRVEERVADTEQRLRDLVENIPAVAYRESLDGAAEDFYISPQVEDVFGYTADEWTWTPGFWAERIHPDDRERVDALDRETNERGTRFSAEYRFRRADGTYIWVADQATLVRSPDGERFWQGFLMDVTERRRAQEAVAQAEARFRALVEQVPVIIYTQEIDPADPSVSKTTYVSPRQEEVLGYTAEESLATGDLWTRILHPDDRERVMAADAEGNRTGEDFALEYRMIAKDGRVVWIHDEATVMRDPDGTPRSWQGFMFDVTERRLAEERLEHALEVEREAGTRLRALDEMKNTFLQAVSHDLRTPLAAILGLAVTLERAELDLGPEDTRDLANRISANARKLDRMVTDLLDLDRLARGIVQPKRRRVDVAALIRRAVDDSDLAPSGRVSLDAEEVVVDVDAAKVERIVENLLANASRHTPAGTPVSVRVMAAQGGVVLVVEDRGPGVPPEIRESIFEPFRQGPDAPEHSPGVGVGLTLVRRFAELHGGRAWVEERPGGGASFRVFLAGAPSGPELAASG
jgi:PAS domain S-box-containing protein